MLEVSTFAVLNADAIDEGKRLVSGFMDSGEPNNQGYLLDYESSKPHIEAYIAAMESRTDGVSKGAVRVMHQPEAVGKIVEFNFDDAAKRLPITVRVDDDAAWRKVKESVYTGFSGGWHVVGKMWEDADLTAKHGRKIMRYTGNPVEVSLVDVPRVPGCEFQSIENADTQEESMPEENTAPAGEDKPQESKAPETVENGLYTASRLGEVLESLSYLQKAIAQEEAEEGDGSKIPDDLKSAISEVAKCYASYAAAQASELMEGVEEDELLDRLQFSDSLDEDEDEGEGEEMENGDFPGHPFRGNQYKKGGKRRTKGHDASRAAAAASRNAKALGGGAHGRAAANHAAAAKVHAKAGNKKLAAYHAQKATYHTAMGGKVKNGDEAERPAGKTINMVFNSDVVRDVVSAALAPVVERIAAMEESLKASVKNADAPAPAPAPRSPAPIAVPHDMEILTVKNGDSPLNPGGLSLEEIRLRMTNPAA